MNYERIDRISEEVRREVNNIIRNDVNDPRIKGTVSITRAEVTRDLRYGKIFVSILEDENAKGVMAALKSAAGFIRRELGHRIIIRYVPELQFVRDENIAYGIHIASVLKDVQKDTEKDGLGEAQSEANNI